MGCNCGNKGTKSSVPVNTISYDTQQVKVASSTPACNKCGCSPCACPEDHTVKLVESSYTTTVCTCESWVMPAVGESVQLKLNNVTDILPGAILWNPSVGHLHVVNYNATTGYVLAVNRGGDDNAEGGTTFPTGLCFQIGFPVECDCSADWTGPCLAADFTSPNVEDTAQVALTTVTGLYPYDTIDIGGYMYKITEILDADSIVVKNEGQGAPVGTVIKADPNCSGRPCQVKITVVNNDNACAKDPVKEGLVLVCNDGTPKPITGEATGQVLGWDNDEGIWKLVNAGISDKCTFTTKCSVTLDPLVTTYIIYVDSPSIFAVGDTFTLDNVVYTVTAVNVGMTEDTNYIRASRSAPTSIGSIPRGTTLCNDEGQGCDLENWCEQISTNKSNITTIMGPTWRPTALNPLSIAGAVNHTIIAESGTSKDLKEGDNSYTPNNIPTLNLTVPSNLPSSYKFGIIGNAYVHYWGRGFTDSHYNNFNAALGNGHGGILHIIISNHMALELSGSVTINGSNTSLGNLETHQAYAFTPRKPTPGYDPSTTTAPINGTVSWGQVAQNLSMPFALNNLSAPGGSTISIKFGTTVTCKNAANAGSATQDYGVIVNEDIHTIIKNYQIIFNAMLVIQ